MEQRRKQKLKFIKDSQQINTLSKNIANDQTENILIFDSSN